MASTRGAVSFACVVELKLWLTLHAQPTWCPLPFSLSHLEHVEPGMCGGPNPDDWLVANLVGWPSC